MTGEKNHHPTCVSCPNYTAYVVSPESMAAFPSSSSSNQDSRPPYFCIISANSPFLARSSLHAPCGCRMKCRTFLNKKKSRSQHIHRKIHRENGPQKWARFAKNRSTLGNRVILASPRASGRSRIPSLKICPDGTSRFYSSQRVCFSNLKMEGSFVETRQRDPPSPY